jgi:preprotein translocase subunit SecG
MIILFIVLIIIASVAISFFILVQNPKGGGLSGTFAGFNTQFMGVKQTTDVLEKGTWILATIIGLLCLFSSVFIPSGTTTIQGGNARPPVNNAAPAPAPAPSEAQPPAPAN